MDGIEWDGNATNHTIEHETSRRILFWERVGLKLGLVNGIFAVPASLSILMLLHRNDIPNRIHDHLSPTHP